MNIFYLIEFVLISLIFFPNVIVSEFVSAFVYFGLFSLQTHVLSLCVVFIIECFLRTVFGDRYTNEYPIENFSKDGFR